MQISSKDNSYHLDSVDGSNTKMTKAERRSWQKRHLIFICCLFLAFLLVFVFLMLYITGKLGHSCSEKISSNIKSIPYGEHDGKAITKFVLYNQKTKMEAEILNLGGTLVSLKIPDENNNLKDIVLGYGQLSDYVDDKSYFGSIIGRYANRIAGGKFSIDGIAYSVAKNDGDNSLHGGTNGWDKAVWEPKLEGDTLHLSHLSPANDQGFPGTVHAWVSFRLTPDRVLEVNFTAEVFDQSTPVSLTLHPYFNLNGEGAADIKNHFVQIFADYYLPVDDQLIPTGEILAVKNTSFDFRMKKNLGDELTNRQSNGYDHNFCLRGPTGKKLAARVSLEGSTDEDLVMEVYTNQPGLQFYTGNFLQVTNGKSGNNYGKFHGLCLEPQNYPDAPNQENFPDSILQVGSLYTHTMWYKFYN